MKNPIIIILILFVIFLLIDRVIKKSASLESTKVLIVRDTVWKTNTKTVVKKMIVEKEIPGSKPIDSFPYTPHKDYDSLLIKFNHLVKQTTNKRIYRDSLVLDSIGYVIVKDTVQYNYLQNRSYTYKYSIPLVKETTTITSIKTKNQLYVGGGFGLNNIQAGVLYKNKSDGIFGAYISPPISTSPMMYGVQAYWKIKVRKNDK